MDLGHSLLGCCCSWGIIFIASCGRSLKMTAVKSLWFFFLLVNSHCSILKRNRNILIFYRIFKSPNVLICSTFFYQNGTFLFVPLNRMGIFRFVPKLQKNQFGTKQNFLQQFLNFFYQFGTFLFAPSFFSIKTELYY